MIDLTYEIKFLSPWHCGSGMSGGNDADYTPLTDQDGFPFIPGKTLKGLFREAAENLCDAAFVRRIFGQASAKNSGEAESGLAVWSNAVLSENLRRKILARKLSDELFRAKYFIRIDESGQAVDHSLRRGEYAVPMTLTGTVSNVPPEDEAELKNCFGFVKELGLQRSRGFGRCCITFLKSAAQTESNTVFKAGASEYFFKCHFLSPVILNTSGATEGPLDTLEYIPGSNFLGIAAKEYRHYGENAFHVFHSGKVRFGCGYPLENGQKVSFPCPASWYVPKGESLFSGKRVRIYPMPEQIPEDVQKEQQPKQVRGGFFVPGKNAHVLSDKLEKRFSLKSAYDREKRKSKDSQMYGYTALNEGSDWLFSVKSAPGLDPALLSFLLKSLTGRRQLGRSKNAQYGSVEITYLPDFRPDREVCERFPGEGLYFLYAKSPLAFIGENGENTLLPSVKDLGFPEDSEIDMVHTQIRYHRYCPWNGIRKSRDGERLVILPGSVIAVKSTAGPDRQVLEKGIGVYLSEGFGEVLCNPEFLMMQEISGIREPQEKIVKTADAAGADGDPFLKHLMMVNEQKNDLKNIYSEVLKFVQTAPPSHISASQWGAVRAIVLAAENKDDLLTQLFKEEEKKDEENEQNGQNTEKDYINIIKNNRKSHTEHPGFLKHGQMARAWQKSGMAEKLEQTIRSFAEKNAKNKEENILVFAELLASEMAKTTKK